MVADLRHQAWGGEALIPPSAWNRWGRENKCERSANPWLYCSARSIEQPQEWSDLGRFRLRNQTTIPTPIPESESFVVHFGGVGIVVIGIGIVVIGIGVGIRWRFHTFMYTYHLTFIQEVTPRKLKALSHRVRNTARWKWICLFRVDCCAVCISMYSIQACQLILFNNGPQQLDFYFCSVHSKETVGLIGQIWPNWVNPVLWCYNAAK